MLHLPLRFPEVKGASGSGGAAAETKELGGRMWPSKGNFSENGYIKNGPSSSKAIPFRGSMLVSRAIFPVGSGALDLGCGVETAGDLALSLSKSDKFQEPERW